jgi:Protein of unknown function with PCYCGC motif
MFPLWSALGLFLARETGGLMNMKIATFILVVFALLAAGLVSFTQTPSSVADIPSFHPAAPEPDASLPALLQPSQLNDLKSLTSEYQRIVTVAYRTAPTVADVLYQQPCYCHCDRMVGHRSLRSCYETDHAVHCDTCLKELFYVYEMKKRGKKAAEIRSGITAGEWQKIDLKKATSHADRDLANGRSPQ